MGEKYFLVKCGNQYFQNMLKGKVICQKNPTLSTFDCQYFLFAEKTQTQTKEKLFSYG